MRNEAKLPNSQKLCVLCEQNWRDGQRPHCRSCILPGVLYRAFGTGQREAAAIINRLVKRGALLSPSAFRCVDCGKQAQIYEHRDYNKPLDIEPTCRPCNARRGYAIPKAMTFAEFMAICRRKPSFRRTSEEAFEPIRRKYWPNEQQGAK